MFEKKAIPVSERWAIAYGTADAAELRALELLSEGLSTYITEYTLEVRPAAEMPEDGSVILIGLSNSNSQIAALLGAQELPAQGYRLKVMDRPGREGRQLVVIAGADPRGLLYGCIDFLYQYLPEADYDFFRLPNMYIYRLMDAKCGEPRAMRLPEIDVTRSPKIAKRGIWCWGHVIYDYRKFLDNMLKLRMNEIIVWNDHPPVNGKAFVEYAHHNGIDVIWGFSWAWGVDIDLSTPGEMERWKDIILAEYRDKYASMGGDGIYFQTFTETHDDMKDGKIIAEEAVKWVNYISGELLKLYPGLRIQFGLHATSVNHRMDTIAQTDPRVEIIWEDCGAFPYSYSSGDVGDFDKAMAFTDQMIHQRAAGGCGAVLKGMVWLDWTHFEYKTGPFVLGCASEAFRKKRTEEKRRFWHFVGCDWMNNADYCRRILKQFADGCGGRTDVTFLVEDAMFEEALWYPVAMAGEMLWNADRSIEELNRAAARRQDVVFA